MALRPEQFCEFLLTDVGFASVQKFDPGEEGSKGFKRAVYVYTK
jgi:hypothetical protein